MVAWPPTSTSPEGSSTALLWYVRGLFWTAIGLHLPVSGSNSSDCWIGISVPGPTTSSTLAPENTTTSPVGSSTFWPNQRAWVSGLVALVLTCSLPPLVSTVVIADWSVAT